MKDQRESFLSKDLITFDDKFRLLISEWKENNQQLLAEYNLEDSSLFSVNEISLNVDSLVFDNNVPEHITEEIKSLFIASLS
ncbi:hypothetical protein [Chryseobacterium sp. Bi04]|uniref:hypothetical protein n=1 Tax=Chryseobacterium sp. Bi04 TaxID=2822345 RepID=UPI001D95DD3E|nr:hypothetical protein [Chryseobacterium sp. Bi04]CAH0297415.1 hypothetical protein SRABI04_04538 [Chryseobacterium sp. Bi04]